jgi:hypothetical protein
LQQAIAARIHRRVTGRGQFPCEVSFFTRNKTPTCRYYQTQKGFFKYQTGSCGKVVMAIVPGGAYE